MNTCIIILIILISLISICNGLQVRSMKRYQSYQIQRHGKHLQMSDKDIVDDGKTNPSYGFIGGLAVAGCSIPPSPKYGEDTLIAEQAVSVVIVLGVLVYSVIVKKNTGRGLPAGPAGLLGAAEGLSYLTVLAALIFVPWQFLDFGGLTSATCTP